MPRASLRYRSTHRRKVTHRGRKCNLSNTGNNCQPSCACFIQNFGRNISSRRGFELRLFLLGRRTRLSLQSPEIGLVIFVHVCVETSFVLGHLATQHAWEGPPEAAVYVGMMSDQTASTRKHLAALVTSILERSRAAPRSACEERSKTVVAAAPSLLFLCARNTTICTLSTYIHIYRPNTESLPKLTPFRNPFSQTLHVASIFGFLNFRVPFLQVPHTVQVLFL